jgi:transposase InsO family protein
VGAVKKTHGDLSNGQGRGRMIALEDRPTRVRHIETAHTAGARWRPACAVAGIPARTLQRWQAREGLTVGDRRPLAECPKPAHALTDAKRERILAVANTPRFADPPPAQIVPALADEDIYIASESSFQRVLRAHGQNRHRGRARAPQPSRTPTTHVATAPSQVRCWDMTYLPTPVQGRWFYLYLILDLYSRKIVGWEIHEDDIAEHAVTLLKRTALAEGVHAMSVKPVVLHGDNGRTLKAATVLAMLYWPGIKPSYSRPRVSDDNAHVESLFKTAKYRPEFPARGIIHLEDARAWGREFVQWHNFTHRHSGIRYVTPGQRHLHEDRVILATRHQTYQAARERHPARLSRHTRNWTPVGAVTLNPEREASIREYGNTENIRLLAT